ncbi:MAG: hypothetical protein KH345_15470 [Eubacterium sp.]|nr:hypothetical protein [Eubacterium sp.]
MKHTTLKLVTAAVIVATTALISGCSNKAQDIDLTLIGGDGQDIENRYTVDIRYDTDEAPINSDTAIVEKTTAPETTPATTKATQPAVTITTDKPPVTTPAQTVRTDLPKVTAKPQYTTASTTTTKPKQIEPTEIETDENGFPANPQNGDKFTDSTGQEYQFNSVFDAWIPGNTGNPDVQEFPRHGDYTYGEGEQILH